MIVHPASDFTLGREHGLTVMSAEASTLFRGLKTPDAIWIEGKVTREKFECAYAHRDVEGDIEFWMFYPVHAGLRTTFRVKVFND